MIYLLIYLAIGAFIVLYLRNRFDADLDEYFKEEEVYHKAKPFMWLMFVLIWPFFIFQMILEKP